jgi:predicted metalloprotease with PDZ domain
MLWLAEGLTSYYDDLLTYRCGFTTTKEYLEALSKEHVGRLFMVPGREAMSTRDSSFLAWLKLYMQSPDGNNRFPSYYLKGGVIFLLLDAYIVDHSDGKYSMDDALREMWKRYLADPSKGMSEEECYAIIEQATSVQIRERLISWLDGVTELPYDEILSGVGLKLEYAEKPADASTFGEKRPFAKVPQAPYMGWSIADANGKLIVRGIDDGSPAAQAGFGIDDEIVAVDDKRVVTAAQLDHYLASRREQGARITAHCDGRLYTTTVKPIIRTIPRLVEIETPSARQQQMRERWLRRSM